MHAVGMVSKLAAGVEYKMKCATLESKCFLSVAAQCELYNIYLNKTYICLCKRFCHTAFISKVGALNNIVFLPPLFFGVLLKSGPQWIVGLDASLPPGSILILNSLTNKEGDAVSK